MKKNCLVCNREFTGRPEKQCCSDKCRNVHLNKLSKSYPTHFIDQALHKNQAILQRLIPIHVSKTVIDSLTLEHLGFNTQYCTGGSLSPEGFITKNIYDFSWTEMANGKIQVERIPGEKISAWSHGADKDKLG